ncbi:hypothetical protein KPC81_05082 [Klebsiella pneumoniae]|nr:hypothetical protein APU22_15795 [Klebsiella pneumoniae]MCB8846180.1 hypothetical protein [Klebsiella pneumoniae]MCB8851166.1 hypothetical protein [Klebsiella pneumoniae]MCB8868223.1 hypothetical protein [Klebsiella pneumoniae]
MLNGTLSESQYRFNADAYSIDNGLPGTMTPCFAIIKGVLGSFQVREAVISPDQIVSIVVMC